MYFYILLLYLKIFGSKIAKWNSYRSLESQLIVTYSNGTWKLMDADVCVKNVNHMGRLIKNYTWNIKNLENLKIPWDIQCLSAFFFPRSNHNVSICIKRFYDLESYHSKCKIWKQQSVKFTIRTIFQILTKEDKGKLELWNQECASFSVAWSFSIYTDILERHWKSMWSHILKVETTAWNSAVLFQKILPTWSQK